MYDCIIAGAGPGGITAAIYLKRAGYNIKLISGGEFGGNLTKISCIENYPGIISLTGQELANNMLNQCNSLNIDIDYFNSIKEIQNNTAILSDNTTLEAKSFIIAIGSIPNKLNIKTEQEALNKNFIKFCAVCDGPFYKNKHVAVLGGGNSAMDFALALSKYCDSVTIIHRRNIFRAAEIMQNKVKELKNIFYDMNSIIENYEFENNKIKINYLKSNIKCSKSFDALFYALGYTTNKINTYNTKNIKFIGDCIDTKYRQVITACGDGCKAALDIMEVL